MPDLAQKIVAALGLIACIVLGVHMMLGPRGRGRMEGAWWHLRDTLRRGVWRLRGGRQARKQAADAAEDAIRRARQPVRRDGNVYRPDAFGNKPRKPH